MVNISMPQFNPFLRAEVCSPSKGGPRMVEDPRAVENFVFQTRSGALDAFEDRLADTLMDVFGAGAEELDDVIAGLNAAGSRDRAGAVWTEQSFQDQMAGSSAGLFAVSTGEER